MYDANQHLRFMRSASNAFFDGAEAVFAASTAWQNALQESFGADSVTPPPRLSAIPTEPYAAWAWTFDFWREQPVIGPAMSAMNPMASMNGAAATPFAMPTWPMQAFQAHPQWPMASAPFANFGPDAVADPTKFWSSMIEAFWTLPAISWPLYHGPLTLMLVGGGMPYAIAAPAARASTAALDAADAMRMQTVKTMSYFLADGGHAAAQVLTPQPTATPETPREAFRRNARNSASR